tara:strand:- start:588 stop:863 length:276 start_codon:yes stop_codon:yes gene_type:complete
MKRLIWSKSENGYTLHERNNISWGTMFIDKNNTLTVNFNNTKLVKTFSSYKVASNVSNTVAERLGIKARSNIDDGNYNLPGSDWEIIDGNN